MVYQETDFAPCAWLLGPYYQVVAFDRWHLCYYPQVGNDVDSAVASGLGLTYRTALEVSGAGQAAESGHPKVHHQLEVEDPRDHVAA